MSGDVPFRLVALGEPAWRAKRTVECLLALTPWRWEYQHGHDGHMQHRRTR